MRAWARRRLAPGDDEGYSLLEVMVAMGIMSVVMIVAFGAVSQIYSATNQVESRSFARDQLENTFRRLDKELRYATWVAAPGQFNGAWYLEYAVDGSECRQLMLSGGTLSIASWIPPATPTTRTTMANNIVLTHSEPFKRYTPGPLPAGENAGAAEMGSGFETQYSQIRVRMSVTVDRVTLPFDTVFTAQNVDRNTGKSSPCSDGRPK